MQTIRRSPAGSARYATLLMPANVPLLIYGKSDAAKRVSILGGGITPGAGRLVFGTTPQFISSYGNGIGIPGLTSLDAGGFANNEELSFSPDSDLYVNFLKTGAGIAVLTYGVEYA